MAGIPPGVDLWTIPYLPPPPGITSDFTKRSEFTGLSIALCSVMIGLQALFVGARIWTQFNKGLKLEDWCAVATVILCSVLGGLIMGSTQRLGRHAWDTSLGALITVWTQRIIVLKQIFIAVPMYLGKCCLLLMYYRIFGHIRMIQLQIYATAVAALPLLVISGIVLPIFAGPPPGKPWGFQNPRNGYSTKTGISLGVINLLVDFSLLSIPIRPILSMNLSRKKKAGVLAIFLTGLIAIIADIVVMYYRVQLLINREKDGLLHGFIVELCAMVEIGVSVICSCMPSMAQIWKLHIGPSRLMGPIRSHLRGSGSNKSSAGLPSFVRRPEPERKRKDPYSIGIQTTNLSMIQVGRSNHLEPGEASNDYEQRSAERRESEAYVELKQGEIERIVTIGHCSTLVADTPKSPKESLGYEAV